MLLLKEKGKEYNRYDGHELNQNVKGRTGSIFEGVTDSITDDGVLMGFRTFAAEVAVFDEFLRVIPSAAGVGHGDGHQNTGDKRTGKKSAESLSAVKTNSDRADNSENAGEKHFFQRSGSGDVNAFGVIRFLGSFHDAGELVELTTNFFDHLVGGFTNRVHGKSGEEHGEHTTDEETGDDFRFQKVDSVEVCDLRIGYEESQSGKSGRANGKAFADSGGGVTDGVKSIGDFTDFFGKLAHLSDTAGVIGDRAIGVNSDNGTGGGKHTNSGNGDTIEAESPVSAKDTDSDQKDRENSRGKTGGITADDAGAGAGLALTGDFLNRFVIAGGVILGDLTDGNTDDKADDNSYERHNASIEENTAEEEGSDNDDGGADISTKVELFGRILSFAVYKEDGNNGRKDTDSGKEQREERAVDFRDSVNGISKGDGGNDGTDIGLEQVGAHTGDVADVITDVIGDNSGVSRVIFRDTGFDFTDKVGTDVSRFGINTAADTTEESHSGSTEGETSDDGSEFSGFHSHEAGFGVKDDVGGGNTEETETDNAETHNGTAAESDFQCGRHTVFTGSVGGTDVGVGSRFHADITGENGEGGAYEEGNTGEDFDKEGYDSAKDHYKDSDHFIFAAKERHSAFANIAGDFFHPVIAFILFINPGFEHKSYYKSSDADDRNCVKKFVHKTFSLLFVNLFWAKRPTVVSQQLIIYRIGCISQ